MRGQEGSGQAWLGSPTQPLSIHSYFVQSQSEREDLEHSCMCLARFRLAWLGIHTVVASFSWRHIMAEARGLSSGHILIPCGPSFSHPCAAKCPSKHKSPRFRELWTAECLEAREKVNKNTSACQEDGVPQLQGTRAPKFGTLPDLALYTSSSGYFFVLL